MRPFPQAMPTSDDPHCDDSVPIVTRPSPGRLAIAALEEILSAPTAGSAHRCETLRVGVETTIVRGWAVKCAPRRGMSHRSRPADHEKKHHARQELRHAMSPWLCCQLQPTRPNMGACGACAKRSDDYVLVLF
jgi:hypothetical protein